MSNLSHLTIPSRRHEGSSLQLVASLRTADPASINLRKGTSSDLSALVELEKQAFDYNRLTRRSFRSFLSSPNACVLIAEDGIHLAGYAIVLMRSRSQIARLYALAVDKAAVRKGIGSKLLAAAEEAACYRKIKFMRLEVREDNKAACKLYLKAGFVRCGFLASYYDDRGNALRLEKSLQASGISWEAQRIARVHCVE